MELIFLGTGTSQGIPVIACDCIVCQSSNSKYHRLRSSVFINHPKGKILIDIGPDFRAQMLNNKLDNLDFVLLTHEHNDHIAGIDDIRAINFKWRKDIPFLASHRVCKDLKYRYDYVFKEKPYSGSPKINLIEIDNTPFSYKGIDILPIEVLHGKMSVLGFRIGKLVYITDAKTIHAEEEEKLLGADILVINALRKKEHHAHLNLAEAIALIERVKPKKAYLTHISHKMGIPDEIEAQLPQNIYLAYDGLRLSI